MTIPRQLAPTVGPAHGGVEFSEGSFSGIERFMINPDDHGQSRQIYYWEIKIMVKFFGASRYKIRRVSRVWLRRLTRCTATHWIRAHIGLFATDETGQESDSMSPSNQYPGQIASPLCVHISTDEG